MQLTLLLSSKLIGVWINYTKVIMDMKILSYCESDKYSCIR